VKSLVVDHHVSRTKAREGMWKGLYRDLRVEEGHDDDGVVLIVTKSRFLIQGIE
jgi:hypothetical protein